MGNPDFEVRARVPLSSLETYEKQGYCADGAAYFEDGQQMIDVHLSKVFDGCRMLGFDPALSAVETQTRFRIEKQRNAVLYITALGFFEAKINGCPLSEDKLIPPMSDYFPRDLSGASYPIFDTMSHRIYYYAYDVTPLLSAEENVLSVHIGRGWLDNRNPAERMPRWGENCLIFRFVFTDHEGNERSLCSSAENTLWRQSYITDTSLYYGEVQNFSFQDSFRRARELSLPHTYFHKADFPGDRADGEILPELIFEAQDLRLYDLSSIPAGFPLIVPHAPGKVTVTYGDKINSLSPRPSFLLRHTGGEGRAQKDEFFFTENEVGKAFHVHFTWHASRYILVEGKAEIPKFIRVNSPLKKTSHFESDSEILNWLYSAFVNTQRANTHGFIPSDCPHRERLGYTGDGQLASNAVMTVFDGREMYRKWLRDILDCQDIYSGHVQHTAPFFGGGGGPGGWGGAVCIVPWNYYRIYGDPGLLAESFHAMTRYIAYMEAHSEMGLVVREEKDGWCLGEWCTPQNVIKIPDAFVNTCFLIRCLDICLKTGEILGNNDCRETFLSLRETAVSALIREYFDDASGSFCGGIQGADAFALDLGLGDERTIRNLIKKYEALGTFDTGIFGTDTLIRVLFSLGQGELAFRLLTNKEETSFYNMMLGRTNSLWENWEGMDSLCHPMFGAVVSCLFTEILGIRAKKISPAGITELKYVKGYCLCAGRKKEVWIRRK